MARKSQYTPEETKERAKARSKAWAAANPEKMRERTRKWREANKEKARALARASNRRSNMRKKYNITEAEYFAALELQNNKCAICRCEDSGKRDWAIDHCHTTMRFRGVLCHQCNTALGLVKDNIETLAEMIRYLQR